MRFFDAEQVADALPWSGLIGEIERVVTDPGATAPERTVHSITVPGENDASLLVKPGWITGDTIAVKAVTFFPDNGVRQIPTVNAGVLLFDASTGVFLGACDGNELTTRRTAAASAVAAKRLARPAADRLLVVGTGALAPMVAQAHAAVRGYGTISVWGRSMDKAEHVVETVRLALGDGDAHVEVAGDLDEAVAHADTISCVTGATSPLIKGALLRRGAHVDLIGAFTREMRESDDDVIRRGSVWVDTRADGVLAGDLAQPIAQGLFDPADIQGDLAELVAGTCPARTSEAQITVFKSAGTALEDLAAANLIFA